MYGTGDLVAFDFDGKKLWARNLQKDYGQFAYQWTYAASPTLFDGKLFVQVLHRNVPVHGRGRKDGPANRTCWRSIRRPAQELWRHVRS